MSVQQEHATSETATLTTTESGGVYQSLFDKINLQGMPVQTALRTLHGVITGFKHLSSSQDEARYEVRLEPRMALLARSRQNAIYQNQTVPQIVEKILRERHQMRGQDFVFNLKSEYRH